jgi:DNA repair protein RadD
MAHMRQSLETALLQLDTGAGKTWLNAALAQDVASRSGKTVIIVAPRLRLVEQNSAVYRQNGGLCSVYTGQDKCTARPVIFTTSASLRALLAERGAHGIALVLIDDLDGMPDGLAENIATIRAQNETLRVLCTTATPYVLGHGYSYAVDLSGRALSEDEARDPPYRRLIFKTDPHQLIADGVLVPPYIGAHAEEGYDVSGLEMTRTHKFSPESVRRAFVGKGRKTESILDEVNGITADSRGVIVFAASIEHAVEEVAPCLPGAVVLHSKLTARQKAAAYDAVRGGAKWLVNVDMATRGFDEPRFEHAVFLRKTESVALFLQMIGRVLRRAPGKTRATLLDYAGNVEQHFPELQQHAAGYDDVFAPSVRATRPGESVDVDVVCPECSGVNTFRRRADAKGQHDAAGYALDLAGARVEVPGVGPMPVHHGRRCGHFRRMPGNVFEQCRYRWTEKICPACDHGNDIAARKCQKCGAELVNPNDKLKEQHAQGAALGGVIVEPVVSMMIPDRRYEGKPVVYVTFQTPTRKVRARFADARLANFQLATDEGTKGPEFIRYRMVNNIPDVLGFTI